VVEVEIKTEPNILTKTTGEEKNTIAEGTNTIEVETTKKPPNKVIEL
jgi:hypothetical protein